MEKFTRPDSTDIHYISLGEGPQTLVFLHGWTASVREWLPFASELAETHRVVCWDARGHGGHSYADNTPMTLADMAADLQDLLIHLEIDDAVLIGHSMGALTAWDYIGQFGQDRLKGLCVIDQSPKLVTDDHWRNGVYGNFDHDRNQTFLELLRRDFAQGVLELIAYGMNRRSLENFEQNSRGFQQMRAYLEKQPAALLSNCWDSITQQDYRAVLPQISVPTLLVYGDESQFYSADLQQWVQQAIPHAELHVYEKSDHSPHLWHKERFIYDLNRFVDAL